MITQHPEQDIADTRAASPPEDGWDGAKIADTDLDATRKTLRIALALNAAIAAGFFATGVIGDSSALLANGVDNSSDVVVYALSLLALSRPPRWKRTAARISGVMLLVLACGVLADTGRRYVAGSAPIGSTMMIMAVIAGVVNLAALWLLVRLKSKDVNVRASVTFSINDFLSNGGILVGGALVLWTGNNWPDLVVGVGVAGIAIYGGIDILRDVHRTAHDDVP